MTREHSAGPTHLRVIKAANMPEPRSVQEISELFDIANSEGEAVRDLNGSMDRLNRVQAAKAALKELSNDEIRAALLHRRQRSEQS